jgi:hypothetical protein
VSVEDPARLARVFPALRRSLLYRRHHGRPARLLDPRTFTEKVNWRVLRDRRELLAVTCDKLAAKEQAARLAPGLVRVPRTLWVGTDVTGLAEVDLPERWVLKPNHSCRRVLVGRGRPDVADLAARTAGWVAERYWRKSEEWAYRRARPCLLAEEFVGTPDARPTDLKVLVLDGLPRLVEVHTGRGAEHGLRLYDVDWTPLPWTYGYRPGPHAPRPERLADLLQAATVLAAGFDMLRVDLYEQRGELWFGELTPYPGAGLTRIEPDLDALLGSWWTLPRRRAVPSVPVEVAASAR